MKKSIIGISISNDVFDYCFLSDKLPLKLYKTAGSAI